MTRIKTVTYIWSPLMYCSCCSSKAFSKNGFALCQWESWEGVCKHWTALLDYWTGLFP